MRHLAMLLLFLPGFGNIACRGEEIAPYEVAVGGDPSPMATGETAHLSVNVRSTERDDDSGWCTVSAFEKGKASLGEVKKKVELRAGLPKRSPYHPPIAIDDDAPAVGELPLPIVFRYRCTDRAGCSDVDGPRDAGADVDAAETDASDGGLVS